MSIYCLFFSVVFQVIFKNNRNVIIERQTPRNIVAPVILSKDMFLHNALLEHLFGDISENYGSISANYGNISANFGTLKYFMINISPDFLANPQLVVKR